MTDKVMPVSVADRSPIPIINSDTYLSMSKSAIKSVKLASEQLDVSPFKNL